MRNIYEIPARYRTAFRIQRLQAAERELEPKLIRSFSISEEREAPPEYSFGEPVPQGRNAIAHDVEAHRFFPERTLVSERVVYSAGDEKPLPIRDAVIEGPTLNRWKQFVANIVRREQSIASDSAVAISG